MRRRHASVQALLPVEEVSGDVIRLRGGEYRAVIEAGSVNFALKAAGEQEAIIAGYRRWLNALDYPVQVLVRVVPTDVERYLAGLRGRTARSGEHWRRLVQDHEAFVRGIARQRTLLERRAYVIVPAGPEPRAARSGVTWPWRRAATREQRRTASAAAHRRLVFRSEEIVQGLAQFGVPARRLGEHELVALWRDCLGGGPGMPGGVLPAATPVHVFRPREEEPHG